MQSYWHRQKPDKPLFPDLLWSRPENRAHAGKLLIIGGNAYGFAAPAEAFAQSTKAGIGTARVLLPDSLQKTVGRTFVAGEYAPSTPSGSFSQKALAELLSAAQWADGTLLAGDFGRNSETAILLEKFLDKYQGQLTITQDAADYFSKTPAKLLDRPETLLVISFAQLQRLSISASFNQAFTYEMDFIKLIDALHDFTTTYKNHIVTCREGTIFVTVNGQVSTTKPEPAQKVWRVKTAAASATWWLQNPSKPFEAITTSMVEWPVDHP
jgi:ADP-dependent NAD(P)H-hydrate dehydratase / NAD(P)H-hydrate epimerase